MDAQSEDWNEQRLLDSLDRLQNMHIQVSYLLSYL